MHYSVTIDQVRVAARTLETATRDMEFVEAFHETPTETQRAELLYWLNRANEALRKIDVG